MRDDFYDRNIHWKAMTLVLIAKFTQNDELYRLLLDTKDVELYHLATVRGQQSRLQLWEHLMRLRYCMQKYDKETLIKASKFPPGIVNHFKVSRV